MNIRRRVDPVRGVAGLATLVFFASLVTVSAHSVFGPTANVDQGVSTRLGTGSNAGPALGGPGPTDVSGLAASTSGPSGSSAGAATGGVGTGGGVGPGGGGGSGATSPASSGTGSAASPTAPIGPSGVSATAIQIGIEVAKDINAETAAVGASTKDPAEADIARVLIDWVNAHGGMAGRKVNLLLHQTDQTQGTWAAQAQAVCSDFTEDHHVFAAINSSVGGDDSLAACFAQHSTPLIAQNFWPYDQSEYTKFGGLLYQPAAAVPERFTASYIDGLVAQHFFDGAKVGLIGFDQAVFRRMEATMTQRLAQHGIPVADQELTLTPGSVADFGAMGAQMGNAMLSFRAKGVDHVLFAEYAGELPFFFTSAANGQNYFPKYAFDTLDRAETQEALDKPATLKGSMAVGWSPVEDMSYKNDHRGGNAALCLQILHQGGINGFAPGGFRLYGDIACNSVFFLKAALDRAASLTPAGLAAAVVQLGTSYDSTYSWATSFGSGRHDGASIMRASKWVDACTCYAPVVGSDMPIG